MAESAANHESPSIERVDVGAYKIPTDAHESDGTYEWDSTTLVVVHLHGGSVSGMGYTYTDASAAQLIAGKLRPLIQGCGVTSIPENWSRLVNGCRNLGASGVCACAISAVDCAMWDLKARLLNLPLVTLLGRAHASADLYASGGFTSYSDEQLRSQMQGWAEQGFERVKMKVGRRPGEDPRRVAIARAAIGEDVALFVDGNGAYSRTMAMEMASIFAAEFGVSWFEEPRPMDDIEGLRLIRDRAPPGMDIAAGEYGYRLPEFRGLLHGGAVDVLQADVTRCLGITGVQAVSALCEAHRVPLSFHCAPALSLHPACSLRPFVHIEYFHDHARIEGMLFDGVPDPGGGIMTPDLSAPGNGLTFKHQDAAEFAVHPDHHAEV